MGMAASQARFLGLTARKSNVEYQGQQVNQQRTSLANESANLYNQMMELDVPTPPSNNEFYKTSYVLEGTGDDYNEGAYKMESFSKTYDKEGEYKINLTKKVEQRAALPEVYSVTSLSDAPKTDDNGFAIKTIRMKNLESLNYTELKYLTKTENDTTIMPSCFDDNDGSIKDLKKNQIYEVKMGDTDGEGEGTATYSELVGYSEAQKDKGEGEANLLKYFYQDDAGKNHFLTQAELDKILKGPSDENINVSSSYTYNVEKSTVVTGTLEKASNGRFTSITINENSDNPVGLRGTTRSLSTVQEFDQEGYDQAMNDYEYNKALYEKSISDINAKTEIIQKQDQQLELRLQQLSTEQNAIATEMDSVTKVIEDNVEKTFKVFA